MSHEAAHAQTEPPTLAASPVRRVLIVAPHFPPSNLAAVHRSRLFARYLPEFGWEPVIVTVHHDFYEEELDWDLNALVAPHLRVERVSALPTKPFRLVGDIGIRGFLPLLRRILEIADRETVDFLYITVPSFYAALLGGIVNRLRGIPFGIDYIDPWVYAPPASERLLSKHWLSRKLAHVLEPVAVRRATLITGVAEGYYAGVLQRNPRLCERAVTAAMPYGGEAADREALQHLRRRSTLFDPRDGKLHLVYAGAMLPRAFEPLDRVCRAIAGAPALFANVNLHFVGTGTSPNDHRGYNVRPVAERHGLWETVITEHPARIPYLDVLANLEAADAVFILGSTEPHYTPSKVYQGVLSGKPIFAVLHNESTACDVIRDTRAGCVLGFHGEADLDAIAARFAREFAAFRGFASTFQPASVNRAYFESYSARSVTKTLANALDAASLAATAAS